MSSSLEGLRVVVTRPADKMGNLIRLLEERGARVLHVPTIAITDPPSWDEVDASIRRLRGGAYEWIAFTSVNAVEKFLSRAVSDDLAGVRVAAVGAATRAALLDLGVQVDLVPEEFTGEALASEIGTGTGRILLPRVEDAPHTTVAALESRGWEVDEVVAYRNVVPEELIDVPDDFDVVTFASGSAARNLASLGDVDALGLTPSSQEQKIVACIGPSTARAAENAGLRVDVTARIHTDEGLVDALEEFVSSRRGI